jgi:hypothetical protein
VEKRCKRLKKSSLSIANNPARETDEADGSNSAKV